MFNLMAFVTSSAYFNANYCKKSLFVQDVQTRFRYRLIPKGYFPKTVKRVLRPAQAVSEHVGVDNVYQKEVQENKIIPEEKTEYKHITPIRNINDFWRLADESKVNAQYEADGKIKFLKEASLEEIQKICLQYRYFVERYPDNLSILLSKMPNVQLKSLLSAILSEELGSGDISAAHIFWYDRFLRSIGVTEAQLENGIYIENEDILSEIEYRCNAKSFQHVIGLVGMGGECLCQIYLTLMYKYLRQNKIMKNLEEKIDWEFWTYHVGEEDIEHRLLVRQCIGELFIEERGLQDLSAGYSFGKKTWDTFWKNNYKNTRAENDFSVFQIQNNL